MCHCVGWVCVVNICVHKLVRFPLNNQCNLMDLTAEIKITTVHTACF